MTLIKRVILVSLITIGMSVLTGCGGEEAMFPFSTANSSITDLTSVIKADTAYSVDPLSDSVCVIPEDAVGTNKNSKFTAGGILSVDIDDNNIIYADGIYDKLYPASLTKLATALVCLKHGNLNDDVTISYKASHITEQGAKLCFLQEGDVINFEVLLTSFLVYSGNDAGVALAEHISGSEEAFVELMNKELSAIGAVDTHYVNPHGLPDDDHYTTVYDIYLMLNALSKYDKFLEITSKPSYTAKFKDASGKEVTKVYESTDKYLTGDVKLPNGVKILAGKTGTTYAAGSCLAVLSEGADAHRYISIVMKASSPDTLYYQMTKLLKKEKKQVK